MTPNTAVKWMECRDPLYGGTVYPIAEWWHHALCCHSHVPEHEEFWLWAETILEERAGEVLRR